MKILVVAAHPDDEVIGLGGTIAKHAKKGDDVFILIVSEGVSAQYEDKEKFLELRRDACLKAANLLGVRGVIFKDLPDGKLDSISQLEINKIIEEQIKKISPDRIYTHHWGDLHKDHKIVYESTLVAARNSRAEIFCYETISSTNKIRNQDKFFIPNTYIDISEELSEKLKAVECYDTEVKAFPHPLSKEALTCLAKLRGVELNLNAAEAFVCVKRGE